MLDLKTINKIGENVGNFRFKLFAKDKYLLTNDLGKYVFVSANDFKKFIAGKLKIKDKVYQELKDNLFIKDEKYLANNVSQYRERYDFLKYGPSLHIVVVTLRCNHRCIYCHASAGNSQEKNLDMDLATAKKVVDTIFQSPNWAVAIEFQGGEPLLNWETVRFIVEYAREKNKLEKKNLIFRLVSNFSLLDEEKMKFLMDNGVNFCTSLDGDEKTHNYNRVYSCGNSYAEAVKWIKKIGKEYEVRSKGQPKSYHSVGALITVSRKTLDSYQQVIDTYIDLGFKSIYLRYLNPYGFAVQAQKQIWYKASEFIQFYKNCLDYILKKNYQGRLFYEMTAVTYLSKILLQEEPNNLDLRSPCGAAIGQLAYNYNGDVYTCDEGRMISRMGEEIFKLGNVKTDNFEKLLNNNLGKAMCVASCTEAIPGYQDHVYKPYLGVCPVYNYSVYKQIFPAMTTNYKWQIDEAILDYLFKKLQNKKNKDIFTQWVIKSKPPIAK